MIGCSVQYAVMMLSILSCSSGVEGLPDAVSQAVAEMAAKLRECAVFVSRLVEFIEVTFR